MASVTKHGILCSAGDTRHTRVCPTLHPSRARGISKGRACGSPPIVRRSLSSYFVGTGIRYVLRVGSWYGLKGIDNVDTLHSTSHWTKSL